MHYSMEFSDLGKQCALCRQLDFLPFQCNDCKKYFCLEHRTKNSHNCPQKKSSPVIPKTIKKSKMFSCNAKKCKTKSYAPMICIDCKKEFCIRHRHHSTHKK